MIYVRRARLEGQVVGTVSTFRSIDLHGILTGSDSASRLDIWRGSEDKKADLFLH